MNSSNILAGEYYLKHNYRTLLKNEFEKRLEKNGRYSLRAYAESLDLDSGTLSQILNGKRKLPKTHWVTLTKKLKLPKSERQFFLQSLWEEQGIDSKKTHFNKKIGLVLSSEEYFEILTDWEYAAALCLFDIKHFNFTVDSVANALGLTGQRANEIYAKLFQYGLLKIVDQKIIRTDNQFETTDDVLSKSLQMAHINELHLAIEKLQSIDVLEREFLSMTFAGSSKDVKKMKIWIRNKKIEFEELFESPKANQIFQFAVQLFPVSDEIKK
jgi:uncharacterized protein (TIGR02147 family)